MTGARSRADARRARTDAASIDHGLSALAESITSTNGIRHERPQTVPSGFYARAGVWWAKARGNGSQAVTQRRSMPIRCYLGPNGAGKTLFGVRDLLPSLDTARTVYSTVPLFDSATGELHPSYVPFNDWQQFMHAEHADFFADEISSIAASRDHNNLHSDVITRMHQLRKIDVTFSWTAPAWRRADLALREVTWAVTDCRGYFADTRQTKGEGAVLWAPRQVFRAVTYDMREFDEWTNGKRDSIPGTAKEWFPGVGSREFNSYRTLDAVERLEAYNPLACPDCGLTRRREYCKGH